MRGAEGLESAVALRRRGRARNEAEGARVLWSFGEGRHIAVWLRQVVMVSRYDDGLLCLGKGGDGYAEERDAGEHRGQIRLEQ